MKKAGSSWALPQTVAFKQTRSLLQYIDSLKLDSNSLFYGKNFVIVPLRQYEKLTSTSVIKTVSAVPKKPDNEIRCPDRGWNEFLKIWVYGNLVQYNDHPNCFIREPNRPAVAIATPVLPETVSKWTGHKNWYEGDVLRWGTDPEVFTIYWDTEYFSWRAKGKYGEIIELFELTESPEAKTLIGNKWNLNEKELLVTESDSVFNLLGRLEDE